MKIEIHEEYCLPADVEVIDTSEFDEKKRARTGAKPGQVAVNRRRSRSSAKLVDREVADLLSLFRTPRTIADAIELFADAHQTSWQVVLEKAYSAIRYFIEERILLPASAGFDPIDYTFEVGAAIDGHAVERRIDVLEDTEVYLVRTQENDQGALKLLRPGRESRRRHFDREIAILPRLPAGLGPVLMKHGHIEGRPYLLLEWLPGISVLKRAFDLRRKRDFGNRELLELCLQVLESYAKLHGAGVLHGDIHPQNVRCEKSGVRLIDFGLARLIDGDINVPDSGRGGVAYYMEPEQAASLLADRTPVAVTPLAEEYSVSALIYELLVGKHANDFVVIKSEMLRQIVEDPPRPMTFAGDWIFPNVERVVRRGLEKRPEDRYPGVADMAAEFAVAMRQDLRLNEEGSVGRPGSSDFIDAVIQRLGPTQELRRAAHDPACPVMAGAAGVALGLHQIACARDQSSLFALADVWAERAARESDRPDAFVVEPELTRDVIGHVSPYHTATGISFTRALLASDRGDVATFNREATIFAKSVLEPCGNIDLGLGTCGCLLGVALLLNRAWIGAPGTQAALQSAGDTLDREIESWMKKSGLIGSDDSLAYLGVSHGWSGVLYARLVWASVTGLRPTEQTFERIDQFAALAEQARSGVRWRVTLRDAGKPTYLPSWCNGNGGQIAFWSLAAGIIAERKYLDIATQAAENTWDEPSASYTLCCGLAGQAYGLLALYNANGDRRWLDRAKQFAIVAREKAELDKIAPDNLFRGTLGVAVLLADLEQPSHANMPLFTLTPSLSRRDHLRQVI